MPADYIMAADRVIFRMHADYSKTQPTTEYRNVAASSWGGHLFRAGVPHDETMALYEAVVTLGTNGFLPTVDQLVAEWQRSLDGGYWEQQNQPEPDTTLPALMPGANPILGGIPTEAAPSWVQSFAKAGHIVCDCEGDRHGRPSAHLQLWGTQGAWLCAEGRCDFRVDANALPPRAVPNDDAPAIISDAQLLDALLRTGFDWQRVSYNAAVEFAHALKAHTVPDAWDMDLLRREWRAFQDARAAVQH